MIRVEAKAEAKGKKEGTALSVEMEGTGLQIVTETLCIVRALMRDIKDQDALLHAVCIHMIVKDPSILTGNDDEDDEETLHEHMAKELSGLTDRSVLG